MSHIDQAMAIIRHYALKSDCEHLPAVSIVFRHRGDRARFLATIKRDWEPLVSGPYPFERQARDCDVELAGVRLSLAVPEGA